MSPAVGSSSLSASDYLLDINKVLLTMADNELLLNSSELSGGLYEDFSCQEDTLKVGYKPLTKSPIVFVRHTVEIIFDVCFS